MSCQISPNTTITPGIRWGQVSDTLAQNRTCGITYVRPDVGGALMPWLFTILQIVIHLPVVIVRVARWEDVQTLSIVLAAFNIGIVSQAYTATRLAAKDVLVWSPMTLVLDAGAMLQLVILVRAEHPNWRVEFREKFLEKFRRAPTGGSSASTEMQPLPNPELLLPAEAHTTPGDGSDSPQSNQQHQQHQGTIGTQSHVNANGTKTKGENPYPTYTAFVIITSVLLFVTIFGLQITGLVYALSGNKATDIKASWCSPMFAIFGISELDLNCEFRPIVGDPHKGIGCISLPGARQHTWLMVTIIGLTLSVVIEFFDFAILLFVDPHSEFWILKLKRPWFTMIFGLAVLVFILSIGASDAYNLPPGITEKIWLVVDSTEPYLCTGTLTPAGLRGQFIGWLDGLLQSWNTTYFGG